MRLHDHRGNIAAGIPRAVQAARAGDDAAGLAISEKMRAQITGLERATNNAQDGISLVQTAEGALTEVHSMLNRMVDLATQASNGTYDNDVDRLNLEKEVVALKEEINRVASSTNFNGIKLLNGELGAAGKVSTTPGTNAVTTFAAAGGATALNSAGAVLSTGATELELTISNGTAAAAKAAVTIAGADFEINLGQDSKYNGYTVNVSFAQDGDASTAAIDDDNKVINLVIHDADLSTNLNTATKVATAVQGALTGKIAGATVTATDGTGATAITTATTATSAKVAGGQASTDKVVKVSDGTNDWEAVISGTQHTNGGTFTLSTGTADDGTMSITLGANANGSGTKIADVTPGTGAVTSVDFTGKTGAQAIGTTIEIGGTKYEFVKTAGDEAAGNTGIVLAENADADAIAQALKGAITADPAGYTTAFGTGADAGKLLITSTTPGTASAAAAVTVKGSGLRLQIGDTADQAVSVAVGDMSATALGLDGVSVASEKGAADSIALIKNAINTVSGTRADLGAIQNRLEHTVNNLTTTTENMTNAESRIRDTDMAKEMMAFTKNNVLAQAAQSMLAQANQQPQQVLQLLR